MVKRTQAIFKPLQQSQEEFKKIITTVGSNSKQITKSTEKFVSSINHSLEEMSNGIYYEITSREYNRD